jgi:spermidine synthase
MPPAAAPILALPDEEVYSAGLSSSGKAASNSGRKLIEENLGLQESQGVRESTRRLYLIFALSGVASLIYEVVWFQLLRLTLGVNAGSLGITLACFMGGLFVGSFAFARWVPVRWDPLKIYALIELGIGAIGLFLPTVLGGIRDSYLAQAADPRTAFVLRSLISAALLIPPTTLMGATLPALSRWVRSGEGQVASIGRLYAWNTIGAVFGALGAAFFLMPRLEFLKTNLTAVVLNGIVAVLAWTLRGKYRVPETGSESSVTAEVTDSTPVYLAYALNGAAALGFEVLWSRMLGMALGATVYAFAIVLGVFLLALGLGGAFGARIIKRTRDPRRAFAILQAGIAAAVSSTGFLVPFVTFTFADLEATAVTADSPTLHLIWLLRTAVVVFPGAFLWGMSFPFALASVAKTASDPAKPVGYLFAYNTVGAVAGSLGASFLLLPLFGSTRATAHLIVLPLTAAAILYFPRMWPGRTPLLATAVAMVVTFVTPVPTGVSRLLEGILTLSAVPSLLFLIGIACWLLYRYRARAWAPILAAGGFLQACVFPMPPQLYMLGYLYARHDDARMNDEIVVFKEGTIEPVVVYRHPPDDSLHVAINGKTCATSIPADMQAQILLGLIPVLLSSDPQDAVVVGLGAGITSGSVTVSDAVKRVRIVELEPKVEYSARAFAPYNHDVMANPKVRLTIDDGRHFIATSKEKFGVITSDPIDPWMAGAAALYTAEHFKQCRRHLIDGGVFMQWVGLYELDRNGLKSILAAFAEAFPDGEIWLTPSDVLLVGSTRKMTIDVEALKKRIAADPAVGLELQRAFLPHLEDLLAQNLCSFDSLKGFLKDSPVNRDGNLYVQFGGFHRQPWMFSGLFEMMWSLRKWDVDKFIVPQETRADFISAIEKQRAEMEKFAARMIEQYRQQMQAASNLSGG